MIKYLHSLLMLVGKRGTILLLFGTAWIVYAQTPIFLNPKYTVENFILYTFIPIPVQQVTFILFGAIAIFCAFKNAKPDRLGFILLMVWPAVRSASFLIAWVLSMFTDIGYKYGLSSGLIWGIYFLVLLTTSGWAEPLYTPGQSRKLLKGEKE